MKYYGKITDSHDLATKGYVDNSINDHKVFIATYNTTTYAEVVRAYLNGQNILVNKLNGSFPEYYSMISIDEELEDSVKYYTFRFTYMDDTGFASDGPVIYSVQPPRYKSLKLTASGWETGYEKSIETTGYKVTSLSSSSTDLQYPSAKCVYDAIYGIETALSQL